MHVQSSPVSRTVRVPLEDKGERAFQRNENKRFRREWIRSFEVT